MGLINIASGDSTWRGLDYYKTKKVIDYKKTNDSEFIGEVLGSNNEKYNVFLNIDKPRSSKCDCPHAKDRRIICKHIVALYFAVFPSEIDKFLKEVEEANKRYEEYEDELHEKTMKYISAMSKKDLQEALIEILDTAPEWIYDHFVRDNVGF